MNITDTLVQLWEQEYPEQSSQFPKFFEWEEKMISISELGFFQPSNMEKAKQYFDLMKQGTEFPPLVVLHFGGDHYELIDGFHRIWARNQLCETFVKVLVGRNRFERCS
ncbi:ParB N-terminal domain-containing protein [Alkalihalobacillus sp. BA299]|uniref:ParB N-terminal domain-containing protein n=1 Tax=Alkalihalobacillus sp. BA299 TaxID=2815938 RepID=UPI001ADD52B4|nr:ParB N-terminal domain-containing protein [Alkalihalobacillus sp. BA299]